MDAQTVGKNISFLRKGKRWTQKELALRLGVSDKAIGKWENGLGYPDISHFPSLSDAFGVSIDFIITEEEINELAVYEEMTAFSSQKEEKLTTFEDNVDDYVERIIKSDVIDGDLYTKFDVKRGLRDLNGDGVVAGLTDVSTIIGRRTVNGEKVPCRGELRYRGYDIGKLISGEYHLKHCGFEEIIYLLIMGSLPNREQMETFKAELSKRRILPKNFVRDVIMKAPSADTMNTMAKSVLSLSTYDRQSADISPKNVLSQSITIISIFPLLAVYAYDAYEYFVNKNSLVVHYPIPEFSTAENILYLARPDGKFTDGEAELLDVMLMLHAEHGGGNNSTFTTHVVTSSGTDTYSAITASLCSLKGSRHGGANLKVVEMFKDLKKSVKDIENEEELSIYIQKLLDKKAFDKSGLVYGLGHAVYSLSDPRAEILKQYAKKLAVEKGVEKEFALYESVEKIAVKLISEKRKIYKGVSVNVDFYSGFVYSMLGIPEEMITPIFAVARVAGWCAHRLEELVNAGKIIRPSYISISTERDYVPLDERK